MNKIEDINGVMINAYPDSIGMKLSDLIYVLNKPELKDAFSYFYVLPTFFNSDLDRGFSIVDYQINEELVLKTDLENLAQLQIMLKFDIVLNHLSVASPQFKDLLKYGDQSQYKDFFINWNEFWSGKGRMGNDGVILPKKEFLDKLFMRKSGLPVLKVPFPDGTEKPYWNTFYQEIAFSKMDPHDLKKIRSMTDDQAAVACKIINEAIEKNLNFERLDLKESTAFKADILNILYKNRYYLGQMDLNAESPKVWSFYEETLSKLSAYGCKILRLDAFAYLHKKAGLTNFFNKPGTWEYLSRIQGIAEKNDLILLPEIHAEYGTGLHREVAERGYHIYDFFLPGLTIHTIESGSSKSLLNWAREIVREGYKCVNMLGCHDGIPVLDLKGKEIDGVYKKGLLSDEEIEAVMDKIMERGGRVKNLYDPEGKKLSYYQVNASFFSALGEVDQKLLLARSIQMFMPGIPQVWYLDLFAGKNDYKAAGAAGSSGHKEINRTTLTIDQVQKGLKTNVVLRQLDLIKLRNSSSAFRGRMTINDCAGHELNITWHNENSMAQLSANLKTFDFSIKHSQNGPEQTMVFKS